MKAWITIAVIAFAALKANAQASNLAASKDSGEATKIICVTSINKTAPLFIVDGKIADSARVKALDPDLIESIDVLKGKKARSLYGDSAINGVIVIRTKKDILFSNN